MSNVGSTIQTILLRLADVLEPLQYDLDPGSAQVTLARLGIVITPTQESSIATPLKTVTGATRDMLQLGSELTAAIQADDTAKIASVSFGLIEKLADAIKSIDAVKTAVDGLGAGIP